MTEPTEPKKAGRPAKHGVAMTASQRVAQSRKRRLEAARAATDDLSAASDQALLDALARRLANIEHPETTPSMADASRHNAAAIIGELAKRYPQDT